LIEDIALCSGLVLEFDEGARTHHIRLPRDGEQLLRHSFPGSNKFAEADTAGKIITGLACNPGYQAKVLIQA